MLITDEGNMQIMYRSILKFKPKLLIGYTSTVKNLCLFIKKYNLSNEIIPLRLIVLTSENVDKEDINFISKVFNVDVAIEYGLAETGVVAYSFKRILICEFFQKSFIAFLMKVN